MLADGRAINTFFDLLAPPPPSSLGVNPFGTRSLNIETRIFLGHIGEEFKGGRSFLETDTRIGDLAAISSFIFFYSDLPPI